jgi:protein-tyrosine phosphatase
VNWLRAVWQRARLDFAWITPQLAVGAAPRPADMRGLAKAGIGAVLDLRDASEREGEEFARSAERVGLSLEWLPIDDHGEPRRDDLDAGVSWVMAQQASDRPTLICCRAGSRRSATMTIAVLVRMGYPLDEAFRLVARSRWVVNPSDAQIQALRSFAAEPRG